MSVLAHLDLDLYFSLMHVLVCTFMIVCVDTDFFGEGSGLVRDVSHSTLKETGIIRE